MQEVAGQTHFSSKTWRYIPKSFSVNNKSVQNKEVVFVPNKGICLETFKSKSLLHVLFYPYVKILQDKKQHLEKIEYYP